MLFDLLLTIVRREPPHVHVIKILLISYALFPRDEFGDANFRPEHIRLICGRDRGFGLLDGVELHETVLFAFTVLVISHLAADHLAKATEFPVQVLRGHVNVKACDHDIGLRGHVLGVLQHAAQETVFYPNSIRIGTSRVGSLLGVERDGGEFAILRRAYVSDFSVLPEVCVQFVCGNGFVQTADIQDVPSTHICCCL